MSDDDVFDDDEPFDGVLYRKPLPRVNRAKRHIGVP